MKPYHTKRRITLSFAEWKGRDYIAVAHGGDASLRRRLSDEPGAVAKGGTVYIPADGFVLTDFFDRYVGEAFIDYSAIKEAPSMPKPKPTQPSRPDLPPGFLEKLRQVRYSDHTVRVYTTYFRDFQDDKVLGQPRRCYAVSRAKREKTLPDVLSKEEVRAILSAVVTDLRLWCMFSVLYSAGLRISELLALKPDDINVSRSLIRVRQGKGRKDRFTLLSKPLIKKLTEYRELYKPKVWLFERSPGEQFTESLVSKRLKAAAQEAGITKRIYPHLLRHSFATHLIEQGTDLKIVKELMGHNSIRTTEIYVHIADTFKSNIKSPLDDILEEDGL